MSETASTAVVLLNWNSADDCIACMDSLLAMTRQDFVVILCDNDSQDDSFERLRAWSTERVGGLFATWSVGETPPTDARIVLVQTGGNLGFAGGCNVGVRYAMQFLSVAWIWLLNVDTIVDVDSLNAQICKMEKHSDIGMLGSTLIYFDEPHCVQAAAGYGFNFWTARVDARFSGFSPDTLPDEKTVEAGLEYVSGASIFVSRRFVQSIGLMNEQYFLYFEEIDWATRAKGMFRLGYCAGSRVFHKEGRSIGSSKDVSKRSAFAEELLSANRVLFLRTYFPQRVPICLAWIVLVGVLRSPRGGFAYVRTLWRGALKGLRAPILPVPTISRWPASMDQTVLPD